MLSTAGDLQGWEGCESQDAHSLGNVHSPGTAPDTAPGCPTLIPAKQDPKDRKLPLSHLTEFITGLTPTLFNQQSLAWVYILYPKLAGKYFS